MKTKYKTMEFVDLKPQAMNRWHCFTSNEHIGECVYIDNEWIFKASGYLRGLQIFYDIADFLNQLNEQARKERGE